MNSKEEIIFMRDYLHQNKNVILEELVKRGDGKEFYKLIKFNEEFADKLYVIRGLDKNSKFYKEFATKQGVELADKLLREDLLGAFANSMDTYQRVAVPNMLIEKFLERHSDFDIVDSIEPTDKLLMVIENDGAFNFLDEAIYPDDKAFSVYATATESACIKSTSPDIFEEEEDGYVKIRIRDLDISIDDPKQFKIFMHKDVNMDEVVDKAIDNIKAFWYKSK